jgi:hypothetical protein
MLSQKAITQGLDGCVKAFINDGQNRSGECGVLVLDGRRGASAKEGGKGLKRSGAYEGFPSWCLGLRMVQSL